MAQLTALLLQLAILLLLVSGTELWRPEGSSVTLIYDCKYACRFDSKGKRSCHKIQNLKPGDSKTYTCCKTIICPFSQHCMVSYHVPVAEDCMTNLLHGFDTDREDISQSDSGKDSSTNYRQRCTVNGHCHSFYERTEDCFLKASKPPMWIKANREAISGCCLRNCKGNAKVIHSAKKYCLVNQPRNWSEAKRHCEQKNMNLAIIRTKADSQTLNELNFNADVWIGLKRNTSLPWKWSDGEDYMYTNWEEHYDPNATPYRCAISTNFKWRPEKCDAAFNFVCQNVTNRLETTEKTYQVIQGAKTQKAAEEYCQKHGLNIASITNKEEQEAFDALRAGVTWIGLKRANKSWMWTSTELVPKDKSWLDSADGDCVKITSEMKWEADSCSSKKDFLCYGDEDSDCEEDATTPGNIESSTTPGNNESSTTPGNNESSTTPGNNESSTTPGNNESSTTPGSNESSTTPGNNESSTTPGNNESSTTPGNIESSTTPDCHGLHGLWFHNESKSWINALEHCLNNESSLVHITDQTVQAAVDQLLDGKHLHRDGAWIGLERSIFGWDVPWVWTSGPPVYFKQWDSNFPRNPLNYHCGKIIQREEELKWLDECCHVELPFICQYFKHKTV
ncbi:macrophage mannose receptor 1-like isoform X2 [Centroberyx affinis]|uniref:macrophage mannose receptor 1-like isoform X2 n=1 Tax=Centroberyx affinis TaxID=166261 RepID=UPI003A5C02FD